MNLAIWKRLIHTQFGVPLGLCLLLQGAMMAVVGPTMPLVLSNQVGLDKAQVTLFFLINTLIGIVVMLGTGYLSDGVVARYKLVIGGGLVSSLGYLGLGLATEPVHAFVSGALMVALGMLFPQLFAVAKAGVVGEWEHEAQVMGITALRTLFSLGFILGTGAASLLADTVDSQRVFFPIAVGVVLLTVYAAVVMYRIEGYIAGQAAQPEETMQSRAQESRPVILPIYALILPLLALAVLQGADSTRRVYLSLVTFHLFNDASIAPLMFGITAIVELVTMSLLGYLASKIGEKNTISLGTLAGTAYFLTLAFSRSLPLMYLAAMWYAIFVAALLGVAMAYIQGLLSHRAGMGGSLFMAVMNFGSLVGLLAPLMVTGYSQTVFIFPAALCIAGAVMLMFGDRTTQIASRMRESRSRETKLGAIPAAALDN